MIIEEFDPGDEEQCEKLREFFSPHQIDVQLRTAIQAAWMTLPKEKRTVDEVERQVRRMVDRAFRDMREDLKAFFEKDSAG